MTEETQGATPEQATATPEASQETAAETQTETTAEAAPPEQPSQEAQAAEDDKPRGLSRSQRRTLAFHKAKAELYEYKDEVIKLREQLASATRTQAPKDTDYQGGAYDPKYLEDSIKFHTQEATRKATEDFNTKSRAAAEASDRQARIGKWTQEVVKANPELEKLAAKAQRENDGLTIAQHVAEGVASFEGGAEVLEHILQNPELIYELNEMSPFEAALELGELNRAVALRKFERKLTKAPAPIKPVAGGASTGPDPNKMSMADYKKWRATQEDA